MNIEEKIAKGICSFIKKNYRRPDYLYLGFNEYADLKFATQQYCQFTQQLERDNFIFNGLEVIVVAINNHLNFGFKD